MCKLLANRTLAIIGPTSSKIQKYIRPICAFLDVPYFELFIDQENQNANTQKQFGFNIFPQQYQLNNALRDLVVFLNWTRMAIIFDSSYGLTKIRELNFMENRELYIYQSDTRSYGDVLRKIKNQDIFNVIIDARIEHIPQILETVWILY